MRININKLKKVIGDYYGGSIVIIYIVMVLAYAVINKGGIYVALTDNLDSNIAILKMIRDNHLFWEFDEPIPFLGGCLTRAQYKVELSIQSWFYILFSPIVAYYVVYICKVILSTTGFYYLAKCVKNYEGVNLHENLWCICGLVYALLGTWPHAALGFAAIPWWIINTYLVYRTRKKRLIILSLALVFTTSFTMLGLFIIFYMVVFYLYVLFKDKRWNIILLVNIAVVIVAYFTLNSHHVFQGIHGSVTTIKSLKQVVYGDSIIQSIMHLGDALFFRYPYYHTGGATLRYAIIPICILILLVLFASHIFMLLHKGDEKTEILAHIKHLAPLRPLCYVLILCIAFDAIMAAFDNNLLFRQIIPFASGFSFSRFEWLSPCFWLVLLALICEILIGAFHRWGKYFVTALIVSGVLSIAFDPKFSSVDSMYNDLFCAVMDIIGDDRFKDGNHEWKWEEYYSEGVFEQVKKKIGYKGEWSIAFGIEPAVLQYNGIRTLDGYYSNYDLEYHDLFQSLIQSELDFDEKHKQYWIRSCGHRAYAYSPRYDFIPRKKTKLDNLKLYIDTGIFKKMGGKYVFSRFKISNVKELNMRLVISEKNDISPYNVYVYEVE